jgi:hypothetical protein
MNKKREEQFLLIEKQFHPTHKINVEQILKNIYLKGCQITSLPRAPTSQSGPVKSVANRSYKSSRDDF